MDRGEVDEERPRKTTTNGAIKLTEVLLAGLC